MANIFVHFLWIFILFFHGGHSRRVRFRDCLDERLKDLEDAADVVITGTVKRLYSTVNLVYSGEVQVKRVIKGDHIKDGETLLVEGFGNKDFCASEVRVRDTKIFLLSQLDTGSFRLNSSLIQPNIPNMDRITAAVKDEPYRRRPPIREVICEKKYCPFNGDCYEEGNRGVCRCRATCNERNQPVCGSDGSTYDTECQMRIESCRRQRKVYFRHNGICTRSV